MILRRVRWYILPPLRPRPGWRQALPLIVFLALFGGTVSWLECKHLLTFARPQAFWLGLTLPWFWWIALGGATGLSRARGQAALMVRLLVVGVLIALLAEPRTVRENDTLAIVYAVDLSDSITPESVDKSLSFATRTAGEKPEKDQAGLVVFARDAAVELPPRLTFPFEAVNSRLSRDGTDLASALALASAVLSDDSHGRIVLVSDGAANAGSVDAALAELQSREIPVDVLPVNYDYEHEVWLEKLELPNRINLGQTYEAGLVLSSLQPGHGNLVVEENGETIYSKPVRYGAGKSRFVFPFYLRDPGYYEYVARIDPAPGLDNRSENNIAINHLLIRGEGRILLVTDGPDSGRDWQKLAGALRASKRQVDIGPALQFPRDPMSLLPYDCVIFVNVPADAFDTVQMETLHDAVYNHGIGFLMVGGANSFGPGGYHRTPVEEALPVTMDISQRKMMPKGALAIILHTCEFAGGNTWGKRITKQAIRVLGADDEAGVLVYDWQQQPPESWLFRLTPASEYNRMATLINNAQIGDMPSFASTMQMAFTELSKSDAAAKHMIIISDGDPAPPPPSLVSQFVAAHISVSTVVVFPHGNQDVSVMSTLSGATGGRYYYPKDENLLPAIFIKEAKTLKKSMIQNRTFTPELSFPSAIMKGIDSLPPLHGYVMTTPKPAPAVTVLDGPEEEEVDPILAVWQHGLGRSAAFASDLSPNWAADWVEWDHYQAFVDQLLTDISRHDTVGHLELDVFAEGDQGVVVVEDFAPEDTFLDVAVQISGPRNQQLQLTLEQVASRRYRGSFPLWGSGRYQAFASAAGPGRSERAADGLAVPYSPEYMRFRANPILLERIAAETGGRLLDGSETGEALYRHDQPPRRSSRSTIDWFLVLLVCLIPLDVGVRRIQIDWAAIARRLGLRRTRAASEQTMSALLRRKQQIDFGGGETPPGQGARSRTGRRPAPTAPPPRPEQAKPPSADETDEPKSTTAKLLARKRRWQKDDDE